MAAPSRHAARAAQGKHAKSAQRAKSGKRGKAGSRRSLVYILLGILVLLAPVILTHYKNVEQNRIAQGYSRDVEALTPEERSRALESARQYNRELPPFGAADPWVNGVDVNSPGYKKYEQQLNVNSVMARLHAPLWAWICRSTTARRKAPCPTASATSTEPHCQSADPAPTVC